MLNAKKLGKKIRLCRNRLGITQAELAEKIHVSFQAISSWECGTTLPDIENLCRLSDVFGVSVDTLLQRNYSDGANILIGVDGGGASTEFILFTSDGNILKRFKLPGTNVSTIGLSEGLSIYHHGLDMCMQDMPTVGGVFIGCAGGHLDEVVSRLSERYPDVPIKIDYDGVNALASADVDAALICDTGTVAIRKENGDGFRKIGGWGHDFGDPGSAYSFGREAIYTSLSYEDGVISSPNIYCILKEHTGASKIRGTFSKQTVANIAALASVIFEAYDKGDELARDIIHCEMRKLAPIVDAACPSGGSILMCGSINQHYGDITIPILKEYISGDINFILPKLPPIYGACREACRRFGVAKGESFEENFFKDYNNFQ